ncbi:MAG: GatB/YqeY domain-containing protein [Patescibacteria group bacterium]
MTSLEQRIDEDTITAMKEKRSADLMVLRQLRSALKNATIDAGEPLTEEAALKVIVRENKKLNDSLNDFTKAGRDDLASATQSEIMIVKQYLPESLSSDELRTIVQKVYNDLQERGVPIQKGPLMGAVMKEVGARAQGSDVAPIIDQIIQ